jgi:hypothetical protein
MTILLENAQMSSSETTHTKQSIDFAELEKPIQEIITLTNKIDERYREKCFEILLSFYLKKELQLVTEPETEEKVKEGTITKKEEFLIPIDVRAFLQTHNIPEESIKKLFVVYKDEIRPAYKITTTKKAQAQIQIALLAALENAVSKQGNKFEFSIENVRQRCQDYKVYDLANFKGIFKSNVSLFKSLADEEHVELSPEGQTELAETTLIVTK